MSPLIVFFSKDSLYQTLKANHISPFGETIPDLWIKTLACLPLHHCDTINVHTLKPYIHKIQFL